MSEKKEMLVVSSKVKKMVKAMSEETGVPSIGKDGLEALSAKVEALVKEAAEKAKADKRKTIKARDLE